MSEMVEALVKAQGGLSDRAFAAKLSVSPAYWRQVKRGESKAGDRLLRGWLRSELAHDSPVDFDDMVRFMYNDHVGGKLAKSVIPHKNWSKG